VSNRPYNICVSDCQVVTQGTFCGKYYRSSTICKRLSTIRLMNAVSWRYILASYIWSFCFYIPAQTTKARRAHVQTYLNIIPHPRTPGVGQQRLWNRTTRTLRYYVVTVRIPVEFWQSMILHVIFTPSYTAWNGRTLG